MLINDWDIANAGARQWNVSFASCKINTNSDWIDGSSIPSLFRDYTKFKTITIKLMLNGKNREQILLQRSNILAQLLEPSVIELDNYSHKFHGIMSSISDPNEEALNRFHTLTFTFDCEEYGDCCEYTMDGIQEVDINNVGNIMTPLIVEITATQDLDYYELRGICRKLSIMGRGIEEERSTGDHDPILANTYDPILGTIGGEYQHDEYLLTDTDGANIDASETEPWSDGTSAICGLGVCGQMIIGNDEDWSIGLCGIGMCGIMICGKDPRVHYDPKKIRAVANIFDPDTSRILGTYTTWKNDLPVTFEGLKAGDHIILNGETGVFINDYGGVEVIPDNMTIWELPTLMPGRNIIYSSNSSVIVYLRYYPRYM